MTFMTERQKKTFPNKPLEPTHVFKNVLIYIFSLTKIWTTSLATAIQIFILHKENEVNNIKLI